MNYGEEYALWYLRLNGFFPIPNFVIHRGEDIKHSSDCDILAIRPPHVYEEIGGQRVEWDQKLMEIADITKYIGLICEVKTGRYTKDELFRAKNIKYLTGRLGFFNETRIDEIFNKFKDKSEYTIDNFQLIKLLIANNEINNHSQHYKFLNLQDIREFIFERIHNHEDQKYADRMFFSSTMFQSLIDLSKYIKSH